ncbi:MAG: glycosyltransferase family 2 protein [Pseudomonadota bacterium]
MAEAQIAVFWRGGPLGYLHCLSLASYRDAGHPVAVYAYDPPSDLPSGIEQRDAAAIMPRAAFDACGRADLAEDRFRYLLLSQTEGVISARPTLCLIRPLRLADGVLFGWQGAGFLGADVLALPAGSAALQALLSFTADPHPIPPWVSEAQRDDLIEAKEDDKSVPAADQPWGLWGARALTHFLTETGEIATTLPSSSLYPIPYDRRDFLLARKRNVEEVAGDGVLALPLYPDEIARTLVEVEQGLPKYWCPVGELLRKHDIAPRENPLPGSGELAPDRWIDRTTTKKVRVPKGGAPVKPPRVMIVTTMKNEGPFILEWIAYHRSIGITDFLVYTNDCDDGTDTLLTLLAQKGVITAHRENPFSPDGDAGDPQRAALWDAQSQPFIRDMDWVIPMDVDEYINISVGEGRFVDLVAALPDATMISLVWRLFGNGFVEKFNDRFITEQMTHAAPEECKKPFLAWGFKTAFKPDGAFERFSVHRPKGIFAGREGDVSWYAGSGQPMPPDYLKSGWRADKRVASYGLVQLNHYSVRSAESYLVKRQRGRVNHVDQDQGLAYWFRMNHNAEEERSIQPRLPAAKAEYARLMADEAIAAQHRACVAAHQARIAELRATPDYAALFDTVTSPRMTGLSKMLRHFGNAVFDKGPGAISPEFLEWADRAEGGTPPEVLASVDEDDGVGAEPDDAPIAPPKEAKSGPPRAPSGDPIYTGAADDAAYKSLIARVKDRYPLLAPPDQPLPNDKITVITGMKNEAPFILEWIAYHKSIGVTDFLVYTNDCTDQTNAILDRLQAMGHLTRLDNPFNRDAGQKPQRGALNDAWKQPLVQESDWYLVIDVDEFLNIHVGDGTIPGMVEAMNDPNVISLTWRFFGNGDVRTYRDGFVTEQFTRCAPKYIPRPRLGWGFKSMARPSAPFGKIGVHRPLDLDKSRIKDLRWVNGSGRVMPEKSIGNGTWFSRKASIGYEMATLNHYILRSAESFLVKRDRGRINHVTQDQGIEYWATRNYSTEIDESILARLGPARAIHGDLMADPELSRLHHEAVAWHQDRIASLKAQPEYVTLFERITDPDQPDALYMAGEELQESEE